MRVLLPLCLLIISCGPKTYTKPEIGMPYNEFHRLCEVDGFSLSAANSVTNTEGSTVTITLEPTPYPLTNQAPKIRASECVGKFVFVDGKLDTISH